MSPLLLALLGCSPKPTEDTFPALYAEAICDAYDSCLKSYFVDQYSDVEDCVEEYTDDADDVYDGCDFDADEAARCLESLRDFEKSCLYRDLDSDDCYEVWDCSDKTYTDYSTEYTYYEG
jgi:hypothetical protein